MGERYGVDEVSRYRCGEGRPDFPGLRIRGTRRVGKGRDKLAASLGGTGTRLESWKKLGREEEVKEEGSGADQMEARGQIGVRDQAV